MEPALNIETMPLVFLTSLILTCFPLAWILAERSFQRYFVYFVADTTFLFLNLLGSISPNVLARYPDTGYYGVHLSVSLCLFVVFLVIKVLSGFAPVPPLSVRLAETLRRHGQVLRFQAMLLLGLALLAVIVLSLTVTPPVVFQFDLFGKWSELIQRRTEVVFSGYFHWYALAFFEAPLFLVILVTLGRNVAQLENMNEETLSWRRVQRVLLPFAVLASVLFLNKQYVAYLLASIALVVVIVRNRIRAGTVVKYGFVFVGTLALLYEIFGAGDPRQIMSLIVHRVLEIYPLAAAVAFDLFPKDIAFLGGKSILNPFGILPFDFVSVAEIIYPHIYGETGAGSAPLPAVFEMYVNFGWQGVVLANVVISFMIISVTLMSWSHRVTVVTLSIYWAAKTTLLWQGPFWFGALEPNLLVFSLGLLAFARVVSAFFRDSAGRGLRYRLGAPAS